MDASSADWRSGRRAPITQSAAIRRTTDRAAPSGQLKAMPNWLNTRRPKVKPWVPPTSSGARKSPVARMKQNIAPITAPGRLIGKVTRRKVCQGVAPRSAEASSRLFGMRSSAMNTGKIMNGSMITDMVISTPFMLNRNRSEGWPRMPRKISAWLSSPDGPRMPRIA